MAIFFLCCAITWKWALKGHSQQLFLSQKRVASAKNFEIFWAQKREIVKFFQEKILKGDI